MHDTRKGYCVGHPQKFLGALLQNAVTSGKDPSLKAKLLPAYLDLPATSPLIDSSTRKYRDWTEGRPAPEGGERTAPEEHFVWLSKDYTPYDNDPGLPFVPPDFTLGLPPVKDWPQHVREPPWVLDLKERPKSSCNVPVDSTSSMDEGEKKKKKKKHRRSKKTGNPELKVTTRGEGADTPVWTCSGSAKDSSSSLDSQSEGDSGLGSNPSIKPRQDTDTKPRQGATPHPSPDHTKQPVDCTVPLSLFADPERILRRLYVFAEEPCKSTTTTSEPCSPVFKEAQPRPSTQTHKHAHTIKFRISLSTRISTVHFYCT